MTVYIELKRRVWKEGGKDLNALLENNLCQPFFQLAKKTKAGLEIMSWSGKNVYNNLGDSLAKLFPTAKVNPVKISTYQHVWSTVCKKQNLDSRLLQKHSQGVVDSNYMLRASTSYGENHAKMVAGLITK